MSGSKNGITLSFSVVDDKGSMIKLKTDADALGKAMKGVVAQTKSFNSKMAEAGGAAMAYEQLKNAVNELTGALQGCADAYAEQVTREVQLETVMRNRMNATAEDIQAMKDLASAQQAVGVVGDEVQLAGMQQIAMFTTMRSSLEVLTPAMNDLIVKQAGLNATSSTAESVAKALGKAMEGETTMLKRMGVVLTEAQQAQMKNGTESERAVTLAKAIEASVGGMNETLAKTDAGKQKQLSNALGDVKEQIGQLSGKILPVLQFGTAFNGMSLAVAKCNTIVSTLIPGLGRLYKTLNLTRAQVVDLNMRLISWGASARTASIMTNIATFAVRGLTMAIRAFMSATIIGAILMAVGYAVQKLIEYLTGAENELQELTEEEQRAADAAQQLKEDLDEERRTVADGVTAYKLAISRCKEFKGTQSEERKFVEELNRAYGDKMGNCQTIAQWYDKLIKNSKSYCQQLQIEARTERLTKQMKRNAAAMDEIMYDDNGDKNQYSSERGDEILYLSYAKDEDGKFIKITDENKDKYPFTSTYKGEKVAATASSREGNEIKLDRVYRDRYGRYHQKTDSDVEKQQSRYNDLHAQNADLEKKIAAEWDKMPRLADTTDYGTPSTTRTSSSGGSNDANKTRGQKISEAIDEQTQKYIEAAYARDEAAASSAAAELSRLNKQKAEYELIEAAAMRPLNVADDYAAELAYQNKLLATQTGAEASATAARIKSIKNEQTRREVMSRHIDTEADTEERISAAITDINAQLTYATDEERKRLLLMRQQMEAKRDLLALNDEEAVTVTDPAQLKNIKDVETAIQLLQRKQETAGIAEIETIQRQIDALQKLRDAYQAAADIPAMQREMDDFKDADGMVVTAKIRAEGFDGLTDRIEKLKKVLRDAGDTMTESQRRAIRDMIAQYDDWRQKSIRSVDTVVSAWHSAVDVVDGVQEMTRALRDNGDTWSKIKSVVSAALKIYEGVMQVVKIVKMFTTAENAVTAGKAAGAVAGGIAAGVNASEETSQVALIASTKELAASYRDLAASKFFAAYASIPFGGPAIAAGFTAGMVATIGAAATPMAKGGIVYGPRLALVGEYAGAGTNPEVVAPLNRLQQIIHGGNGTKSPRVIRLVAKGRELVGVFEAEQYLRSRR